MTRNNYHVPVGLCILLMIAGSCGRNTVGLKGQSNATLTFFGSTVDQEGTPLPGVRIEYECEAFPADWTFDKRGEPLVKSVLRAVSDDRGRFSFTADAHTLRRLRVDAPTGYRHFYEKFEGSVTGETIPSTYGYLIKSWSDLCYKTDAEHPAVFVFVKDGVTEVSALPCRGGFSSGNGQHWVENLPAWPKQPSLTDVVRKGSTTTPGGR